MATRREKIEAMLADEPDDVFLRYSLALELFKDGELEASLQKLSELTQATPPYVPAFFMSAQQCAQVGRVSDARRLLRTGIEAARDQQDSHAAAEMSEFLASLGTESDG